jgi:hypothetical protein
MAVNRAYRGAIATLTAALIGAGAAGGVAAKGANMPTVVKLTQVGCQFVESENGVDHGFMTMSKADCDRINARTGAERLKKSKVIMLKPGKYTFRVTNKNVPYVLGFWLRESSYDWRNPLHKLSKISVSGGGLTKGGTRDYTVELKPGEYVYSCPLNTTPDYRLVVAN